MKAQLLKLIVLLLFVAVGGFAAQAQDTEEPPSEWFVHYNVSEEASSCNKEELWLAHNVEWNLPDDGRIYWAEYMNGVFLWDYDGSVSGYYTASGWFIRDGARFLPYTYRRIVVFSSDSGLMPTIGFAFNLYCDEFNNPTVTMEILPF